MESMQNDLLLSEETLDMKKNWKKMISVLLLAVLLCVLPGTLAWATDISAITPDNPSGNQIVGEQTGDNQTGGTGSDGAGSGTSTGTDTTTGGNSGSTGSGTPTEGSGATSGDTGGSGSGTGSDTGTTGDTGTSGTSGNQTGGTGSGSSTGTGSTTGGSATPDTTTGQSGSDSGSTATPEATPTPTPTATPTPTPTPTPSKPVVTKDPTDETVDVGGDCLFIGGSSNALNTVWHFVSPDGKTDYRYDAQEIKTAFPGLRIQFEYGEDYLHLLDIPAEMNGWRACCEYSNNVGSVRTGYAVVHVNGAPAATPTPSPSATPTPKPSPTPSPAATATPAPSSSPAATPSPVLSPTPEGTGEPPAALNRGGKIFLLFGAGALLVGAAAIGTILTVSKRTSAKEAYTYKNSTRRRK